VKRLRIPTKAELEQALGALIDWFAETDVQDIEEYVVKLRAQNPGITDDDLARKIVRRKSLKCGLVGAVTGIPGLLALPATVPADLITCWRIQIVMAVAVARVYSHTAKTTDLKTDILLILAGNAANYALKRLGIEVGKSITKNVIDKVITREVMKGIWKVVSQKIITKAGEKSLTSFMKAVPLVGAPIGFAFDYPAARIVGRNAITCYSGAG
jgi:hypothetical protein